ncbi:pullulanase [Thalassobacillus pellis]|uniref:pullulanase n=1 Tax=Thalassobacillus pellis TaxID=748008 RepID=UPI0019621373|nr:pullulanase [Thalassobacillus pellis]MBM7553161.1 secreted pullulanase [Thalassobacillus pellis]
MYQNKLLALTGGFMFFLAFTAMAPLSFSGGVISHAEEIEEPAIPEEHVRIHYKRMDANYEGWGLHLWNQQEDNPAIDFTVDWGNPILFDMHSDWGMYVDIPVIDITNGLNFIVHKGDTKDTPNDRSFPSTGEREFWLVQGDEHIYLEKPAITTDLTYAEMTTETEINARISQVVENFSPENVTLTNQSGQEVTLKNIDLAGQNLTITTAKPMDILSRYTLSYKGNETEVDVAWELLDRNYSYEGDDLGATLHEDGTATLKLWSPIAQHVSVVLYDKHNQYEVIGEEIPMNKDRNGVWSVTLDSSNSGLKNLKGFYYQYKVTTEVEQHLTLDPYAKSMAASSDNDLDTVGKAAIVDPSSIGPKLHFAKIKDYEKREDAVIWEVHVRDFTSDPSIADELDAQFGTFSAFIEKLDYLKELGVTHIQLLPVMKYYFGDELENDEREMDYSSSGNNYNWGYDPHSYFALSGMYSERPEDPEARIAEFKQLIKEIHKRKMGVILDVVYNHTAKVSILENIMPDYYHFMNEKGETKTGYGGGKVGTTHQMSRKLMVDSVKYWVKEFKVDGFRFDLMGDLDAESVQTAYNEARKINPDILMIGEGWRTFVGDGGPKNEVTPADQDWMDETDSAGVFSDEIRNELKSGFGSEGEPRFLTGGPRDIATIFENIKGQPGNVSEDDPGDIVQYIAAHDNLTLHDVIALSIKKDPAEHEEEIQRRIRLGNAMILTSQGVSFLHAGQEYGRTKQWLGEGVPEAKATYMVDENGNPFKNPYFIHDSYDSTDAINHFDWKKVTEDGLQKQTMQYTKGLIDLRRSSDAFRLATEETVNQNVTLIEAPEIQPTDLLIGYKNVSTDNTGTYYVFINADNKKRSLSLDVDLRKGKVLVDRDEAGTQKIKEPTGFMLTKDQLTLDPLTTVVIKVK